jgi:N-formylglutamate deformylase
MSVLEFRAPERGRTPVIVEVPHAGLTIPAPLRADILADENAIGRDADLHVDALYASAPEAGAALLTARLSRYVVDLNRAPDDIDLDTEKPRAAANGSGSARPASGQPRGVVWKVTTEGRPVLRRPLDRAGLQQRLEAYHAPYHDALRAELERTRSRFGYAVLVAGHSMPSTVRRGAREVERRADVVPGSLGGTSADRRVIDLVDAHFRSAGLSVRHDDPYRGGFTTAHYGRPADGWHAIQIELNRALYMDEATLSPKSGDFARLQGLLTDLVRLLGELELDRVGA